MAIRNRKSSGDAAYRLAIFATHPIQYHAPWFRAMAAHPQLDIHVFFCHNATPTQQAQAGFGVSFEWDRPLLDGYPNSFLRNVAKKPMTRSFRGLDCPQIRELIAKGNWDAVLVNGWNYKAAWQAIFACWRSGIPVMMRGDSHLHTPRSRPKRALKTLVYRRFIPRFDACLSVGTWSREYYQHYNARPEKVFLVPHVVDEDFFAAESQKLAPCRSQLRARWGLSDSDTVFLFVGKFIELKRPMEFVHAIQHAVANGSRVQGLMVGDGPLRSACEALATEKGIPVRFTGFLNQSEIAASYTAADALVLLSPETWGLVVNEAMCCGRACLVSDQVGSGPDLILPGETGEVYPISNVAALGNLISSLANQGVLEKMGNQAREHLKRYSIAVAVQGVIEAVTSVAHRRSKQSR
jgi:glycosyltransferase involved in cell wall biosynthesis